MTALLAGFECGRLGWNGHDLLRTTRHMPEDRMPAHYDIAPAWVDPLAGPVAVAP